MGKDIINEEYNELNIQNDQRIIDRWEGERHDRLCSSCL